MRKVERGVESDVHAAGKDENRRMNLVSSATVYRFFPSVFVFSGINGNGTENGTE
jgi:hypothetical protein